MNRIRVHLKDRSYDIEIGKGLLKNIGKTLRRLRVGEDAVIITNKNILSIYKKDLTAALARSGFAAHFELVPDSESSKSAGIASRLIEKITAYDKKKDIFIIAFGGGVIGDLAGFVAAVYKRGVPYIQIPTTLLAQVDSSIGGKVAIDLPAAKNMVGAFYQPRLVLSDTAFLNTLSQRQIRSGLAEIIKYGVIKDSSLFEFLEANYPKALKLDKNAVEYIVSRSSRIKADVVSKDELDRTGVRTVLNYGHTLGHAIEAAGHYSNRYSHGEAVAIGMVIAARLAEGLGMIRPNDADRIEGLIKKIGLPVRIKGLKAPDIFEAHLHDKKFQKRLNKFVLPERIGKAIVVDGVPDFVIKKVLKAHII